MRRLTKLSRFAKTKLGILSIGLVLILLSSVAFISTQGKSSLYAIEDSRIIISGTGGTHWELDANSFPYQGEFIVNNGDLESIENVSFEVPINWLQSNDIQMEELVKGLFLENNCHRITFQQRHGMVLPIMKMIHLVGELGLASSPQSMAFQANYRQQNKSELLFESKQEINLSDFGIQIPADKQQLIDDKVEVKVQIKLVKNTIL
ncbi:MAG: hypothetical protein EOO99_01070 [Pedobacter sp.]|nr:MAG: hypothetical protein EOO99_01070 [Pedobacter sp.]